MEGEEEERRKQSHTSHLETPAREEVTLRGEDDPESTSGSSQSQASLPARALSPWQGM